MDFAKRQMQKYGWKEGQGLGKKNDGIAVALKPKLKFDTHGLGRDVGKEIIDPWWARVYDEAAKNISTKNIDDGVVIETESVEVNSKKKSKKKKSKRDKTRYDNNFILSAELTVTGEKKLTNDEVNNDSDSDNDNDVIKKRKFTSGICELTDEELFKACGNRTAHKGARHGLKMNAKLLRLEAQDLALTSSETIEKPEKQKHKKKKKEKE